MLAEASKTFQESSRLVLFETALRTPEEIGDPTALPHLSLTGPTDTAADIPATIQTVLDWLAHSKPGNAEIWIASDLQRTSWRPDSDRWTSVAAQLQSLPQNVRLRLLTMEQPPTGESSALGLTEVNRRHRDNPPQIEVVMNIERNNPINANLPLTVSTEANRSLVEVPVQGQSFVYRHKIPLENASAEGWGKMEIPADENPRDNILYFVYGPPITLKTAVVAGDEETGRVLKLAAAPVPSDTNRLADVFHPDKLEGLNWSDYSLVLWCAPLPKDPQPLRSYVEGGGQLLFFPAGAAGRWEGVSFEEPESAEADKAWKVERWEDKDGPLAKTEEGWSLPLSELTITRRQTINGGRDFLASFNDGKPFLTRRTLGKGAMLFCAAGLAPEWSNLRDNGTVLVLMVQRLLAQGGRRFTQASFLQCGDALPAEAGTGWLSVEGSKDARTQAGVYRSGSRLIAVNRPASESDPETIEPEKARSLFAPAKVQLFTEQKQGESKLQSELWRTFLYTMVLFLLVEAALILPPKEQLAPAMAAFRPEGGVRS
jgi:hypothetical protein